MKKQDNLLNYRKRRIINMPSEDTVKVIPEIKNRANIYENGSYPEELSFTVSGAEEDLLDISLSLEMPFEEKLELPSLKAENGGRVTVKLPDLSERYGIFYLEVTVKGSDGEVLCEQSIPFSHLRVGNGKLEHCGASIHALMADVNVPDGHFAFDTMDTLALFGSGILRDEVAWRVCEKEKGKIEVDSSAIKLVDYAVEKGIKPHLVLCYGNDFYDGGKSPETDEGYAAYARYCAALAECFKGKVYNYEIWNEYNSDFSSKDSTPETYARLVKEASEAVKAVDPEIKITAGVIIGTQPEWIRRMLKCGVYDSFDEISIHPYCNSAYPDENQGNVAKNAQLIRDVISEFGEPKPVWASEIGWTVYNNFNSFNREQQAAALTRLFAIAETSESLEKVTFYDIRNDGSHPLEMEPNWGMIEFQDSIVPFCPKESLAAASCLNWMIGDAEFAKSDITADIKCLSFKKNGERVSCIYSLDGIKKTTLGLDGDCDIYDMYGNLVRKAEKGEITLELNEYPTYFVGGGAEVVCSTAPDKLVYDFPYTVSAVPVLKEDGWYISALVHCHTKLLRGRIRIELPEIRVASGYAEFRLNEGEKYSVEAKVDGVDPKRLYRALAEIMLFDGEHIIKDELVSFLSVPYGDEFTEIVLDTENDYVTIGDNAPIDATAKVRLSYNDEALLLSVDVTEETHMQYAQAGDIWKDLWDGDGIELMLQPLYDGNREITKYNQIGLGLSSFSGERVAWLWNSVSNRGAQRFFNCDFKAERNGNITSYNAVFKWKDILPPNISFEDCDSFGFAMKINKTDDPDHINGFLALYRGIGWWKPPLQNSYLTTEFGRFILEKGKQ